MPVPPPPGVWLPARRALRTVTRPLERFLHIEAASGLLLLAAAAVALVWANSPFRASYQRIWHAEVTLGVGPWKASEPVHFIINDVLMVIFFFVAGLEIRREIHEGELSTPRRAALPAVAALGGMLAPAAVYFGLNHASPARGGWGVPMATDIAFAVGALALLGKRVPASVRVLLLALAIIDDIGAIAVIAVFYSSGFSWGGAAIAGLGVAIVFALRATGIRSSLAYVAPGVILWAGLLDAGVHPTIAGVVLGLLTPARPWYGERGFLAATGEAVEDVRDLSAVDHDPKDLLEPLGRVAEARREAVAPVVRLEAALHPWVAYGIMPLFALANAGVDLRGVSLAEPASAGILAGVLLGLVVGKPLGVIAASALAVKLGLAARPRGVTWGGLAVVGVVAGIGFTMAMFIADLAFDEGAALGAAKLGVLAASVLAGLLAMLAGRLLLPAPGESEALVSVGEAERSAEDGPS
jgi:Na+:H+ antiporter, NhaA family